MLWMCVCVHKCYAHILIRAILFFPLRMSTYDIKNYLEKIYKVPVLDVSTAVIAGKSIVCLVC